MDDNARVHFRRRLVNIDSEDGVATRDQHRTRTRTSLNYRSISSVPNSHHYFRNTHSNNCSKKTQPHIHFSHVLRDQSSPCTGEQPTVHALSCGKRIYSHQHPLGSSAPRKATLVSTYAQNPPYSSPNGTTATPSFIAQRNRHGGTPPRRPLHISGAHPYRGHARNMRRIEAYLLVPSENGPSVPGTYHKQNRQP